MNLHKEKYKRRIAAFLLIACFVLMIFTFCKLFLSYYSNKQASQIAIATQYMAIAERIADGLDKKAYERHLMTRQYDSNRDSIKQYLETYRESVNALFIYTLELDESDVAKTMIGAHPDYMEELPVGIPCTVPAKQVKQAKNGQAYYTDIITDEHFGVYVSVGVPFYNEAGKMLGVLGIDIDVSHLELISKEVMSSNKIVFIFDIVFILALLLAALVLYKWYRSNFKQELLESQKIYVSELGKVIASIKSSRHDLMNHLSVLHGLMHLKLYDKASDYLNQMTVDAKAFDLSVRIKNPVLIILLQSKWELAKSKNIDIHYEVEPDEYDKIESMDLVKILANLLDNAIEATELYDGANPKQIRVACQTVQAKYRFIVENPAILSPEAQKGLFQVGYTTKHSDHALRGNGLMIIARTVEKYDGIIDFQYEQEQVVFQVTIASNH